MSYDPANPTVYFDIGEAIAAIGILLAFISLANPNRRFRWRLGWFRLRTAYFLFFFGILCVLIAAGIPVAPFKICGVAGWPLFWEVLAGLAFTLGSLGLILSGARPVKLTKRTGRTFFGLCYSVIARGDDQELGALAEEIAPSAESVVRFAKGFDRIQARAAKESGREYEVTKPAKWACRLMDLWSDKRFCNVIVTRCPGTAIEFFKQIKAFALYNSGGYSFVQQLIREAFRDRGSILHREEPHAGLGHFQPFTETVFGDFTLVNSGFRPLQAPGYQHDNLIDLEKFNQCLLRAVRAYLEAGEYNGDISGLWCGVGVLADSGKALVGRMRDEERSYAQYTDRPSWALTRVPEAFKGILKMLQGYEAVLPEYSFDEADVHGFNDRSIYGTMARGIYEFYDGLTRIDGHDWETRTAALEIWMEIYSPSAGTESRTVKEIQKRLEVRLWEQVEKNLERDRMCYPMITRLLISVIGLWEHPSASDGEKRVSEELRRMIKEKFSSASKLDEKRARELLPEGYEYDTEKKMIVLRDPWGAEKFVFQCD